MNNTPIEEIKKALDWLVYECHQNAVLHGFHEGPHNFGEKIALIHSELSECLETHRKGTNRPDDHCPEFRNIEVELADAVIRIFDLAGCCNMRLAEAIVAKHEYNKTRPYKHAKKY